MGKSKNNNNTTIIDSGHCLSDCRNKQQETIFKTLVNHVRL